jgi:serine protease Do
MVKNMKEPFTRINKHESDLATFTTRSGRPYRLPQKISKPKAPKLLKTRLGSILAIILLCFGVGFGGGLLGARTYNNGTRHSSNSIAAKQQFVSDESSLISSIAKTVGQSVVSIDVHTQVTTQDFFGVNQAQSQEAAGTGFIISDDGIIVTNRHVVPSGTTSVSVTLSDGTRFDDVDVIGRTSANGSQDVAFLKINDLKGKTLIPAALGDSSKMQIGDRVVAIGNALGQFQNTVTSGIISGFGRDVIAGDQSGTQTNESLTDLFQTDAAINEGNSGGPLVNINGEVIGINTAIASGAQNIGFAQPINDVKGLITSVLGGGKLQQPYLGVRYVSLTNDIAKEFNLKTTRGAYVTSSSGQEAVVSGSPADKAGLKDHDVITKVNNITINSKTSLTAALSRFKVGDKITLTIVRDGKSTNKEATLEAAPQQ